MKALLLAAVAATTIKVQAETVPFLSQTMSAKCATVNRQVEDKDARLMYDMFFIGLVNGASIMMFMQPTVPRYIPLETYTTDVFTQTIYLHCKNNPADTVSTAVGAGLAAVAEDKM